MATLTEVGTRTFRATWTGASAEGNVSVPGVLVGDIISSVYDSNGGFVSSLYKGVVGTDDYIYQNTGEDLSALTITAIIMRYPL